MFESYWAAGHSKPDRYAWDGRTLWLDATIETPTELRVTFGYPGPRSLTVIH